MKAAEAFRRGEPWIWVTGAVLGLALLLIGGMLTLVVTTGLSAFWPRDVEELTLTDGVKVMGERTRSQLFSRTSAAGEVTTGERSQFRVANRDLDANDFKWFDHARIAAVTKPADAVVMQRWEYGDFIGRVVEFEGKRGEEAWVHLRNRLPTAGQLHRKIERLREHEMGEASDRIRTAELKIRKAQMKRPEARVPAAEAEIATQKERYAELQEELARLTEEAARSVVVMQSAGGQQKDVPLDQVIRVLRPNADGGQGKLKWYLQRMWEYVSAQPREANMEGGIFPAIFGTVLLTLLLSLLVTPFGVLAALYLREYARPGLLVTIVRVAVNNLAGVPSIVFGMFGLGFFVYFVGGGIDAFFFEERLPTPTFGTGGILWASLTLAVMTAPVVIVATEEALASVPRGRREASLALGASKFQTICRIVVPGAIPGILTGMILAMARGAGEVAPLMITGVIKYAPTLPLDGNSPFLHLERKFMHLGFHIFDVGFQSPNVEAAKPMVFTTTLLLIAVVLALNLTAIRLRDRVRRQLSGGG